MALFDPRLVVLPIGPAAADADIPLQRREQRGHHRRQELAAEIVARLPHALEEWQQVRPIPAGPAGASARGAHGTRQPSDRGLAVTACRAAVLVAHLAPPALVGDLIPLAQSRGVLPTRSFGHGASFPVRSVTPVLRNRPPFQ